MSTLKGFTLVAVIAVSTLTGCAADPGFGSGAATPLPRAPGIAIAPGPFSVAPAEKVATVDRVRETRERNSRSDDRPIARRPRSGCPSCE
jgi:hypothetical protein